MNTPGRQSRIAAAWRGARLGALVGLVYAAADSLGAALALPELFDPSLGTATLIGVAWTTSVMAAAILGSILLALVPRNLSAVAFGRRAPLLLSLFAALVVGLAFAARRERRLPPPAAPGAVSATRPRPVLFVVLDTLRADVAYPGADGGTAMPNLAAFAASSLRFTDAESTAGWTLPSLAGMLTGIHNSSTDASAGFLVDWAPTLAEHLHAAGYVTHAVVDNSIVEARVGFGRGYQSYFMRSGFRFAFALPGFRLLPRPAREVFRFGTRAADIGAARLTDQALTVLGHAAPDRPLFLYVHYMDPHTPYYDHGDDPADSEPLFVQPVIEGLRHGDGRVPTAAELRWLWHRYRGEARYLDEHLGRLLSGFRARFGDDAIVVITADHGEEMLDHGRLEHSFTVQRELVRVPLVMALPGVAPRTIDAPVSLIDLTPSLLASLGVTPVQRGVPMVGVPWGDALGGATPFTERPSISHHTRHGRSVYRYREGPWVYLKTMYFDASRPTEQSLYDLSSDPTEQRDLFAKEPEVAANIAGRFETLAAALNGAGKARNQAAPAGGPAPNEEALRALGYIQ